MKTRKSPQILLDSIYDFNKVVGYKVNIHKTTEFVVTIRF